MSSANTYLEHTDENKQKLGENLKRLRKEKGWRQIDLAFLIDTSPSAISQWENGHRLPMDTKMKDLCKVFGVGVRDLLR